MSERERGVDAAPEDLVLVVAHVALVAQGVRGRPGVVDLRADREPVGNRVAGRKAKRLVRQFRAAGRSGVGVVAEADLGLGRESQRLYRFEVVRKPKREVDRRDIRSSRVGLVPVGGSGWRHDVILVQDGRVQILVT